MKKLLKSRKILAGVAVVFLAAVSFFVLRGSASRRADIPVGEVKRGDFVEYLQIRGEIRARNSKVLTAPSSSGDLQIIKLPHTGTVVHKDDVVLQFDTTTIQRTLEQKRSDLKSADAEIERQAADGRSAVEQNITDSMAAKYGLEKARLDVQKQEILSEIDGEKTKLTLADSQQKVKESEEKINSGRLSVDADVAMKKKKREKAVFDVQLAERQIASMTLRAPSDGMLTTLPNFRANMFGNNAPDFKEGDRAWPGAAVAEIPDLSEVRFEARIDESDRGQVKPGETALVHIDAIPDRDFPARIRDISTLAKLDFSGWPPAKNFSIDIQVDITDPRIRPGMSANSRIAVNQAANSILIPAESLFQKNGKTVVYVQEGNRFTERVVKAGRRSGSIVQVLDGVKPGEHVALKDPTAEAARI